MRETFTAILSFLSRPVVALGGALLISAAGVVVAWNIIQVSPTGAYVPASLGSITDEVDVSAALQAASSTDLSFQVPGQIASIKVAVGDHVTAGETLLALDNASAAAALNQAKANFETQQANLASLLSGTRPEQLAIDETALTQAQSSLEDAIQSAYVYADDAVHAKADQSFINPRTTNAQLAVQVPNSNLVNRVQNERVALEPMLTVWQQSLASSTTDYSAAALNAENELQTVSTFLSDLSMALSETQSGGSTSAVNLSTYQAAVTAGRVNITNALTTLTAADTAYQSAAGGLTLAQAGATKDQIEAQQALVDAAQAAVESAQVALADTVIVAPISGTITAQNANSGETIAPGTPLVSIESDGDFEADAQVSDTDVAKIVVGDMVNASFDAYPGVVFPATVTTVDPAATLTNGIPSYTVTVTFTTMDPRLKPGLSTNLSIIAKTDTNAITVPSSAVITSGTEQFVYIKGANGPVETPVTTGIMSATGQTEILSGLTVGEEILTFGNAAQ